MSFCAKPFHAEVIDEVMTSYGGDATAQFIEVRMLAGAQTFVSHSVLAAFDTRGAYIGDILVMPNDLTNGGNGVRWLVGTMAFQTASGEQRLERLSVVRLSSDVTAAVHAEQVEKALREARAELAHITRVATPGG